MKMVLAIVRDEDGNKVLHSLNKEGYSVTKMASTGGFLKSGNMTLLIGTEDDNIQNVIDILKTKCEKRKQTYITPDTGGSFTGMYSSAPIEVDIGGATIFVMNVERFEKL